MTFWTRSLRLPALLSALLLTFVLAACSSDDGQPEQGSDAGVSEAPETALKDAVSAMAEWDGVALEISFDADDEARASLLEENPDDAEVLDVLLNSSLRMTTVGDEEDGAVQLAVNVDGTDVFELYAESAGDSVGAFALRVDLPTIAELVDDPQMEAELDMLIAQAGMFGLQDAAQALSDGDWVAITGLDALTSMMEDLGGAPTDEPDQEQVDDAAQALADRTGRFVDDDVDVTYVGSESAGERLRVVAEGESLQTYLQDVAGILATNDLVDGVSPQELQRELDEIPSDAEISLDVWISGGELARVAVDLAQVDDTDLDGEFLLIVDLEEHEGSLSAPNAATTVDVMSLFGQFMGGGFDLGDAAFDGSDDEAGDGFDDELSQDDIDMMLQFMDCISEEDLEGFELFMPELAEAAEQALADGTLESC